MKTPKWELQIQECINNTKHRQQKTHWKRIYEGLLCVGRQFGERRLFQIGQKDYHRLFGKHITKEQKQIIGQCLRRMKVGNNLDLQGYSEYIMYNNLRISTINRLEQTKPTLKGRKIVGDVEITLSVPETKLRNAISIITLDLDNTTEGMRKKIRDFNSISSLFLYGKLNKVTGAVDINASYQTDDHGRMHSFLSRLSKRVRQLVFGGWVDVDINSAAPSLLVQLAKNEYGIDMPKTKAYIENKDTMRNELAEQLEVPVFKIKQLYTALFFGINNPTKCQSSIYGLTFAMHELIGKDNARFLQDNKIWTDLVQEIKNTTKLMADFIKKENNGNIINLQNKKLETSRKTKGKILSHIYMGIERTILDLIMEFTGTHNVVPIHDGFISKNPIDIAALQNHIKNKTGYEIQFSNNIL